MDKPDLSSGWNPWDSASHYFNNAVVNQEGWIQVSKAAEDWGWFRASFVSCSYPTSGQYAAPSRYLFYVSIVLSTIFGNKNRLQSAISMGVVIYSTTACFHALLTSIFAMSRFSGTLNSLDFTYAPVLVRGPTATGLVERGRTGGPVWLPIVPFAEEADADPLLTIIGVTMLWATYLQTWSRSLRTIGLENTSIFICWRVMLPMGLVAAYALRITVLLWRFPQLRFCPWEQMDALPLDNNGPVQNITNWDERNLYRWNRTISDAYFERNSTLFSPQICLYPCASFDWIFREQGDMIFDRLDLNSDLSFQYPINWRTAFNLYIVSLTFAVITYVVLLYFQLKEGLGKEKASVVRTWWELTRQVKFDRAEGAGAFRSFRKRVPEFTRFVSVFYAKSVCLIVNVSFLAVQEWLVLTNGKGSESIKHVGQWGAIVGTVFVVLFAVISKEESESSQ